jgi:glycosyltransferase involved in cell wall biosynthesis
MPEPSKGENVRDFERLFDAAEWKPATGVQRPWVRFANNGVSDGVIWHVPVESGSPRISLIIPTADADRGGYFRKLMHQLGTQTFQDFELLVIKGDKRQGRGINIGAQLACGEYLLTLDDDSSLPDSDTLAKLVQAMDTHPDIGMAGGNNTVPEWATPFVKRVMRQIPRRSWEPVREIVDSDLAEHPCLIMRTALFRQVGGENEQIPRGLDPYLRKVFRDAGSRVVILPGIIYHHLPPETWKKLLTQFYRNGWQAAYANIHSPEWVIETPSEHGAFTEKVPLWRRVLRFPLRMLGSLFAGKWVWVICEVCYAVGFMACYLRKR